MITLKLTPKEADAVWIAMLSIADDLDDAFPEPQDRSAFRRARLKLREAAGYTLRV